MTDYDNTNSGVLFKNDRKERPNQPDYRGSLDVEGVQYWVSAWIKTAGPSARNPGSKFFSIAIQEQEQMGEPTTDASEPYNENKRLGKNPDGTTKPPQDDDYDDIPF